MKLLSCVWLFATPWTAAHQAPLSMGFSRQEYWSGLALPSPMLVPTSLQKYHGRGTYSSYATSHVPYENGSTVWVTELITERANIHIQVSVTPKPQLTLLQVSRLHLSSSLLASSMSATKAQIKKLFVLKRKPFLQTIFYQFLCWNSTYL